jgi:hypothetical protein
MSACSENVVDEGNQIEAVGGRDGQPARKQGQTEHGEHGKSRNVAASGENGNEGEQQTGEANVRVKAPRLKSKPSLPGPDFFLERIQGLKEQRDQMKLESKRLSKDVKMETRKRARMTKLANRLTSDDLLKTMHGRQIEGTTLPASSAMSSTGSNGSR